MSTVATGVSVITARTVRSMLSLFRRRLEGMPTSLKQPIAERLWLSGLVDQRAQVACLRDLRPEFYATMATDKTPEVRIALLINPDTPDEIVASMLATEKRADVLAACLSRCPRGTKHRATLVSAARERMTERPTVALAAALVEVVDLEPDLVSAVLTCLVSSSRVLPSAKANALSSRLSKVDADEALRLLDSTFRSDYLVDLLSARPAMTREAFRDLAARTRYSIESSSHYTQTWSSARENIAGNFARALARVMTASEADLSWVRTIDDLASRCTSNEMRQALTSMASDYRILLNKDETPVEQRLAVLLTRARANDQEAGLELALHPQADDTQRLTGLLTLVHTKPAQAVEVAGTLGMRRALVEAAVVPLARGGCLEEALGDTAEERLAEAVRLLALDLDPISQYYVSPLPSAQALLKVTGITGLRSLKWTKTMQMLDGHSAWSEPAGVLFAQECADRLTTEEHWSSFDELSASWTATTGDLFDAVEALSQERAA